MGVLCVKESVKSQAQNEHVSPSKGRVPLNTIQTKMDKTEYQRLQIIKECLTNSDSPDKNLNQPQPERQISDFKFIRHLGNGAYGQVLMVKDMKSGQFYAMKIIKKDFVIEREEILNALSERYILAAMHHPFVVKLHYAFQTKNKIHLIVDLMAGVILKFMKGELFYLLRKNQQFTEDTARFYAAEIVLALEYLHQKKIIYRDLKPENILLDKEGHIKLTDFGLSKVCLKKNEVTTSVCGTPEYIAPEVLKGKGYSVAADWFSFGSLLYDMLTGKPPFYSKDKDDMMRKIQTKEIPFPDYLSPAAKSLLKSLFEKKQQNRIGFKTDAQEIKNHEFFKPIDFDDIYNKKLKTPFSFDSNINPQGFAVQYDEFQGEESYEKEIIEKSKGVNFEGFTYQVKGAKFPESKIEINSFDMHSKNQGSKDNYDDQYNHELKMEFSAPDEKKQVVNEENGHKQIQQTHQDQQEKDVKPHKRSTFSMSIHELQKKNGTPVKEETKNGKELNVIKETQKHSLHINETFQADQINSINLVVSHQNEMHSPPKKEMSFRRRDELTTEETVHK